MVQFSATRMVLLATSLLIAQYVRAQTAVPSEDQSTLHVYVNLVQIPVLVLNSSMHPMPPIPPSQFNVSIEGIGRIRPARIRMEGDDPINLALIVDRSDRDDDLWKDLPKSLDPLLHALQPHDRLSVYAMDGCSARRMGEEMAPFQEGWLRRSVASAMKIEPFEENRRKKVVCEKPLTYWDMVYYSASRLALVPGRKLMVTLGPGALLSSQKAVQIHEILISNSISFFPIVHGDGSGSSNPYGSINTVRAGRYTMNVAPVTMGSDSNAPPSLLSEAERSGGLLLGTTYRNFAKTLAQPVALARGRYIIEFPRPDKLSAGQYHIVIADGHPRDFIRPAGISVPLADPKEKQDPAVEHGTQAANNDPSAARSASSLNLPESSVRTEQTEATPTPVAAPHPSAPAMAPAVSPAKPVASKAVDADPTDITGDLRPSH